MVADPNGMGSGSPSQTALAQMAALYGGTQAIPTIQRSQYLADALQAMRQHGGENIRTGGALASNLLADALLQFGQRRANAQLLKQIGQGQGNMAADAQTGIYAPPQDAPSAPNSPPEASGVGPSSPPPQAQPSPASSPMPTASASPAAMTMSPQDRDLLARTLVGEAGDSPEDMRAAGSVILNRSHLSGQGLADVIHAPHQFEAVDTPRTWARLQGLPPTDPHLQQAYQIADDLASKGPAGPWDHFYAPHAQAALGRPMPGWDNGTGQQIGGQKFFALGYGGHPALAPGASAPPQGPLPQPMLAGGQGSPMPPQPPQAGPGPASPFGAQPQGPQGGQMIPAAYQAQGGGGSPPTGAPQQGAPPAGGPPTGQYATPEERAYIERGLQHPQGSIQWQQAVAKMQEIQQRRMTPLEAPKDMMWDNQRGAYVAKPGTQYSTVANGPGGVTQADPFGQYHSTTNPNAGPIPAGMTAANGPNGPTLSPMQGSQPRPLTDPRERAQLGILPSDHNAYAMGPDGKIAKVADNPYGPKEIQSVHDNFWGSDETKKAQEAYSAFTGLTNALGNVTKNNGPLDQAAMDSFLRGINPGMGARNSTVQMVMTHFGLPQELQGHISSLLGNGFITPQGLQQMVQITHDYAVAHQQAAQSRAQSDAKMVAPYGYGAGDLSEDLPQIGAVPQVRFGVQSGNASPGNPSPNVPGVGVPGNPQGGPGNQAPPVPGGYSPAQRRGDGRWFAKRNADGKWFEVHP